MSPLRSRDIAMLIKEKFGSKFQITLEEPFPFDTTSYRPDVVVRSSDGKAIKAIIEIEQCSRKHVVGGVITADYCVRKDRQHKLFGHQKPRMFVLSLKNKNTENYKERLPMLKRYTKFKGIVIGNKEEIFDALAEIQP